MEFPKAEKSAGPNKMVLFALVIFTAVVGSAFMIGEPEDGKSRVEHFMNKVEEKMGIVHKPNSEYIAYDPDQKPLPVKRNNVTRFMFVGDSLTFGSETKDPVTQSYPAQLYKMMTANPDDPSVEFINMGMPWRGVLSNSTMPYSRTKAYN